MTEKQELFYKQANSDPSNKYFFKQLKAKTELVFVCYQGVLRGKIQRILKYDLKLVGQEELLNKTHILYLYKPDAEEALKGNVHVDYELQKKKLPALMHKKERFQLSDEILAACHRERKWITLVLRNGHILKGKIHSYGIFSVRLQLTPQLRVVVMRHSVQSWQYPRYLTPSPAEKPADAENKPAVSHTPHPERSEGSRADRSSGERARADRPRVFSSTHRPQHASSSPSPMAPKPDSSKT